ncbi:MAG: hypothetical protein AABO41_04590 [Acidobacteriota bacterium]
MVFHGLLSFCYTEDRYCEVGVFTASDEHELTIQIIRGECPSGSVEAEYSGHELQADGVFKLEILNGTKGVTSFQTETFDPRDFRYLPDVEGPHFFNVVDPIPKRRGFYTQRLFVEKGVFYTLDGTASTFNRNDKQGSPLPLGNIAYYVAANIKFSSAEEYAVLRLFSNTGTPISHEFRPGAPLREIHIINSCIAGSEASSAIDFNLHFQSLQSPYHDRFEVALARAGEAEHTCENIGNLLKTARRRSTDPAPCAGAGYGSSGGTGG